MLADFLVENRFENRTQGRQVLMGGDSDQEKSCIVNSNMLDWSFNVYLAEC